MRYSKEFVFKKKKREVYETWYNRNEKTKLVSYIYKTPKNDYHFTISSVNSPIKKTYSSLEDDKVYNSFDEARHGVMDWWHENF